MSESPSWISPQDALRQMSEGTGEGIKIAVIDSGVEVDHPDLAGLELADDISILRYISTYRVVENCRNDAFGHGTAVAAILHQLAPKAEIGSFRVLGEDLTSRNDLVAEGVRQAIDRGYHILNCSFGCRGDDTLLPPCKRWIDEAYLKGVHIVAACNNQNHTIPEWPSHFPSVISVNMMDCSSDEIFHVPGTLIEFGARGVDLEVAWKDKGRKQVMGSSYAAPHVSAALARILTKTPDLPPLHVKDLLHRITVQRSRETGF